jgi:hypothetical protein
MVCGVSVVTKGRALTSHFVPIGASLQNAPVHVRETSEWVMGRARHVKVNAEAAAALAATLVRASGNRPSHAHACRRHRHWPQRQRGGSTQHLDGKL